METNERKHIISLLEDSNRFRERPAAQWYGRACVGQEDIRTLAVCHAAIDVKRGDR